MVTAGKPKTAAICQIGKSVSTKGQRISDILTLTRRSQNQTGNGKKLTP